MKIAPNLNDSLKQKYFTRIYLKNVVEKHIYWQVY